MKEYQTIISNLPLFKGKSFSVEELKGGLTNTNFKIRVGKKIYIARFAPKNSVLLGLNKKHEFDNCKVANWLEIGSKPVAFYPRYGLLVLDYITGHVSSLERMGQQDSIWQLGALLKKLHSGPRFKNSVDIFVQSKQYFVTAKKLGCTMPEESAVFISCISTIEKQLKKKIWINPAHLDLVTANVIHTKDGLKFIDWEYSGNADGRFDLATISFMAKYDKNQDRLLLKSYGTKKLDVRQLELMKCVVALREVGWALVQTKLSPIKYDYEKHAADYIARFHEIAKNIEF